MNIRLLSVLAMLSLLGLSVPALAAPPGSCAPWPDCKNDGSSGDDPANSIGVHGHYLPDPAGGPLWAPTDALSTCVMEKFSGKSLSGAFPRHDLCATLTTSTGDSLTDDIIVLVHTTNRGVVLGVEVQGQDLRGAEGIVHISDVMAPVSVENLPDGSMVIHVHGENANLYRCDTHVLKQKSVCDIPAGFFALHDLVYSPDP